MAIKPYPTNRWRKTKQTAVAVSGVASTGVGIAQQATGASAVNMVLGAAATGVSATGIGLVVTSGVLTIGTALVSGRSAYKSRKHRKNLQEIQARMQEFDTCDGDQTDHSYLAKTVLPYVIKQKGKKYKRKIVGAMPGINLFEGLRAAVKYGYKKIKKTQGVERANAAGWLAVHLGQNCGLAEAIVSELYSEEEMEWMRDTGLATDFDLVVDLLMQKIKST